MQKPAIRWFKIKLQYSMSSTLLVFYELNTYLYQLFLVISIFIDFRFTEASMNATGNNTNEDVNNSGEADMFCWAIEGVCILIIGLIGIFGNSCSMVLFSRQKVHRIFHHLLLLLTCFDMVRNTC